MSLDIGDLAKSESAGLLLEIYRDLRKFGASLLGSLQQQIHHHNTRYFDSIRELKEALKSGEVRDGTEVVVQGKLSTFSAFDRPLFLPTLAAFSTELKLGPQLAVPTLPILGPIATLTSNWAPSGVLPILDADCRQFQMLDCGVPTLGVVSIFPPPFAPTIETLHVIGREQHAALAFRDCHFRGRMRLIGADAFARAGYTSVEHELLSRDIAIWVLDLQAESSFCEPLGSGEPTELWAGLFAQGHLEFEGTIPWAAILDPLAATLKSHFPEISFKKSEGQLAAFNAYGRGFRAMVSASSPTYAMHMDADIALDFRTSHLRFSNVIQEFLNSVRGSISDAGSELGNPMTVDFHYAGSLQGIACTDAGDGMTVDNSFGSLARAISKWHALRKIQ